MNIKQNIKPASIEKILYLVFAVFLSVPIGGYVYNLQAYFVHYKVECVFIPYAHKNKACYHYNSKKSTFYKKAISNKIFVCYKYPLIHFANKVNNTLIQQEIKSRSIPAIELFPSNKYHNDCDDYDLRIPEFVS